MKKQLQMSVTLSPTTKDLIEKRAKQIGLKKAEYVKHLLVADLIRVKLK
jgi:hypothetical protein